MKFTIFNIKKIPCYCSTESQYLLETEIISLGVMCALKRAVAMLWSFNLCKLDACVPKKCKS